MSSKSESSESLSESKRDLADFSSRRRELKTVAVFGGLVAPPRFFSLPRKRTFDASPSTASYRQKEKNKRINYFNDTDGVNKDLGQLGK